MRRVFLPFAFMLLSPAFVLAQTESEPNDAFGQANALPAATATSGDMGCASPGGTTDDYFSIVTPADGMLNITTLMSNSGGPGNMQLQVFNGGGGLIYNNSLVSPGGVTTSIPCYGQGQYYVRFYRNTADCYSYSISWTLTQPGYANDTEPNSSIAEAPPLAVNTNADGHVNFLNYGDNNDYYQITTTADGRLTVSLDASAQTGAAAGAQLQFFNSGGGLLENWSGDVGTDPAPSNTTHILDCRAAGIYYLRVYSNIPCGMAYRLNYQFAAPFYANDVEPNNSTADADAQSSIGPNTNIDGHINFQSYGDNDDYYRINSPDQGIINFTVIAESKGAASGTGVQLQLFNSGGGLTRIGPGLRRFGRYRHHDGEHGMPWNRRVLCSSVQQRTLWRQLPSALQWHAAPVATTPRTTTTRLRPRPQRTTPARKAALTSIMTITMTTTRSRPTPMHLEHRSDRGERERSRRNRHASPIVQQRRRPDRELEHTRRRWI